MKGSSKSNIPGFYCCRKLEVTLSNNYWSNVNINFVGDLKKHVEAIHEGVRYPCDQCDYRATQPGNVKRHETLKHC